VKDQSHKDEMSAAIRGDFQRLRERGVAATLTLRADELPDERTSGPTPAPDDTSTARADAPATGASLLPSPGGAEIEAEPEHPARALERDDPVADDRVPEPGPEPAPPQPVVAASADESPARSGLLARLLGR
jgi:hypothetical protein